MLRGARHHAGAIREPFEAKVLVEGPIAVRVRDEPVALRTVATEVVERPVDEALAKAVAARLRADYEQEDARNRAEVRLGAHLLRGADFIEVDGFGGLDVVRVFGALACRREELIGALTGLRANVPEMLSGLCARVGAMRHDDANHPALEQGLHAPRHLLEISGDLIGRHEARHAVTLGVIEPRALHGGARHVPQPVWRIPGVRGKTRDVV